MALKVDHTEVHISHTRTVVRAITWRIIATATTMVTTYIVTRQWEVVLLVGGIDTVAKLLFYYLHDRAWLMTSWGVRKTK
jgi:uncharacterized membrane protein